MGHYKIKNLTHTTIGLKLGISAAIALLFFIPINATNIYVFGDSHSQEFTEIPHCKIIYLGPVTMHRIGEMHLSS